MPKTLEHLLEENNRLLRQQNRLLARVIASSDSIEMGQYMEGLKARARRETPWGCKPPTWAK